MSTLTREVGESAPSVCLFAENSHRLVSLWNILNRFDCPRLHLLIKKMGLLQAFYGSSMSEGFAVFEKRARERWGSELPEHLHQALEEMQILEDDLSQPVRRLLDELKTFCESAGFDNALDTLRLAGHRLNSASTSDLRIEVRHLEDALFLELTNRVFLQVEMDRLEYLEQPELFGPKVRNAFPKAEVDIREAGNCLAAECNGGAVFHLMRIAEHGLRALARDRRVELSKGPIDLATWEDVIKLLEKAEQDVQGYPKTLAREAQFAFYHGAMIEFRAFKNVWRNRWFHTRENDCDRDLAHSVMVHVREFMKILASRISETKRTPVIWKGKKWITVKV